MLRFWVSKTSGSQEEQSELRHASCVFGDNSRLNEVRSQRTTTIFASLSIGSGARPRGGPGIGEHRTWYVMEVPNKS
jgi:hypothetical protein